MLRRLLAPTLACLIAALLAPVGSAQLVGTAPFVQLGLVDRQATEGPLPPGGSLDVAVALTVQFGISYCQGPFTVRIEPVSRPEYASLKVSPDRFNFDPMPGEGVLQSKVYKETLRATIATTEEAPAFHDGIYILRATAQTFGPLCQGASSRADLPFAVKNGYRARIQVEQLPAPAGQGDGTLVVRVRNLGNGPGLVRTELVAHRPEAFQALIPPPEVRLAAPGPVPGFKDLLIHYVLAEPGPQAITARFTLGYDGTAPEGPVETVDEATMVLQAVGEPVPSSATKTLSGSSEAVVLPFPGLASFLAVALAAFVARRRIA